MHIMKSCAADLSAGPHQPIVQMRYPNVQQGPLFKLL